MNTPTTTRFFGAGLCATALGLLSAPAGAAPPTPTIIQGFYQQSTDTVSLDGVLAASSCAQTQACFYLFTPVRAGKQLIITQISCTIPHNTGSVRVARLFPVKAGQQIFRTQYFVPVPTTNDRVGFSEPTLQLFTAGERPVVEVDFDQPVNIFGACTIAGQIKDAV
jgi:hypothetical protein